MIGGMGVVGGNGDMWLLVRYSGGVNLDLGVEKNCEGKCEPMCRFLVKSQW